MYGKIFEQIYDSSIAENWITRVVFQDFIILSDEHGVVDRTAESISRRTNVPLEHVTSAIKELEAPDPASRSKACGGARLRKLDNHRDWGWEIINYRQYRDIATQTQRQERTKLRTRKYRESKEKQTSVTERHRASQECHTPSPYVSVSVSASDSDKERGNGGREVELPAGFPASVDDAIRHAEFVGADVPWITEIWNGAMARGGYDGAGQPIRSWRHYLAKLWARKKSEQAEEKVKSGWKHAEDAMMDEQEMLRKARA